MIGGNSPYWVKAFNSAAQLQHTHRPQEHATCPFDDSSVDESVPLEGKSLPSMFRQILAISPEKARGVIRTLSIILELFISDRLEGTNHSVMQLACQNLALL